METKKHLISAVATVLMVAMILTLIFAWVHDSNITDRQALEAGYVQKPNVNGQGYHWEKP